MNNKHTNDLIHETSPYLLQHAHNPVNWYAWNRDSLQKARKEDKIILVSIGYSACHWCHVMEHESFEDEEVAAFMNKHFINVKIDREERPDLDHIYMDAVQAIAGNGGWPLNVFLTPDGKPFYGGTYFPPRPAYKRPSWMQVLTSLSEAWKTKRNELETQADNLLAHLRKTGNIFKAKIDPGESGSEGPGYTKETCLAIAANLMKNADTVHGGFGNAPKFPQTFSIIYLLQHAHFFNDQKALDQAEISLTRMYEAGIYDQLAGGLCRYSTDREWLVPHFEKMLYDNALFISALAEAYLLTRKEIYLEAVDRTISFITGELSHPGGGYYAAIDADSENVEGKYYVWSYDEVQQLLGKDAPLFCRYYDISVEGNWEHTNILNIKTSVASLARESALSEPELNAKLEKSRKTLLAARNKRVRPGTDDKIILGWNALLISSFCHAYRCGLSEKYKHLAINLFEYINKDLSAGNAVMYHSIAKGKAKQPAFLDDYAFLIQAAIALQEITGDQQYLDAAVKWLEFVSLNFSAGNNAGFYFSPADQEDVLVRKQEVHDGALPSSNAIMAANLLSLGRIFSNDKWITHGLAMLGVTVTLAKEYPGSFGVWAKILQNKVAGVFEIVVTGKKIQPLFQEVLGTYIPNALLQSSEKELMSYPLLQNKSYLRQAQIYICRQQTCLQPVTTINGLIDVTKSTLFNNFTRNK